ncbi:hypothetical protein QYE76_019544 [Lolium multiflorum]|uniref:F-box domain-containing protein n=1 Tax=Lolium multiflorum TaxID=4521 RepID=A0AAD8VN85_LOLMU|nr:hypothetical protein QYE76_019544 [Lolium multiflorum]
METAARNIERLPEELLAAVISLTSPPDACCAAAVSRTFRAVADSDDVWSQFLPCDLPEIVVTAPSKKALFKCLCDKPTRLPCKLLSMQLDRATGDMFFMLSKIEEPDVSSDEDEDETPEPCEWISIGCGDIERNKRSCHSEVLETANNTAISGRFLSRKRSTISGGQLLRRDHQSRGWSTLHETSTPKQFSSILALSEKKTTSRNLNLNNKEIVKLSKILKSKGTTELMNQASNSRVQGADHNNIINVYQQIKGNVRSPKTEQRRVSSRAGKTKTAKDRTEPSMPSTGSLFESI